MAPFFLIPMVIFLGDVCVGKPGFDEYDNERYSLGYLLEHNFSDQLKLRHSLRTFHADRDIDNIGVLQSPLSSDGRLYF